MEIGHVAFEIDSQWGDGTPRHYHQAQMAEILRYLESIF